MIFNNQIRYWFKDKSKIIWLARFTKFHENSVVIIDVMLFVFLWLFKTNHHRFSSIYLCLDFWLWSSTRLSCLLRIFSSFQLQLLFFPLLHFNQKCLPSKTWKTAAAQKIGREAYPHYQQLFNCLDTGHYLLFIEKTLATPNRIYLSPICELPAPV